MHTTRLKGRITRDHQLVVEIPSDVAAGTVDVILLHPLKKRSHHRVGHPLEHPAFGLWAKRAEIEDSASFAADLRQRLETRSDGNHHE